MPTELIDTVIVSLVCVVLTLHGEEISNINNVTVTYTMTLNMTNYILSLCYDTLAYLYVTGFWETVPNHT